MQSTFKIFNYRQKSENGFILIAAIMAVMIIMAVSFFILATGTEDVQISTRLVGERKAMSAAEACVHQVCINLNPGLLAAGGLAQVDPIRDPTISCTYNLPHVPTPPADTTPATIPLPGFDMSKAYVGAVYITTVTGTYRPSIFSSSYDASVTVEIGTVFSPNPGDTQQGQL